MPAKLIFSLLAKAVAFKDPWKLGEEVEVLRLCQGDRGAHGWVDNPRWPMRPATGHPPLGAEAPSLLLHIFP